MEMSTTRTRFKDYYNSATRSLSLLREPKRPDPPLERTTILRLREEAEQTSKTIDKLKTQLTHLEDRLERIIDDLSSIVYPVNTLPTEILCRIFAAAVSLSPHFAANRALIRITAVCRHWRAIAIADPRLWTQVCYLIHGTRRDLLAENFLARIQKLPIKFSTTMRADDDDDAAEDTGYILPHFVFQSAAQWEEASLTGDYWPANRDNEGNSYPKVDLPQVTKLTLDILEPSHPPEYMIINAPRLHELSIRVPTGLLQRLSFPTHQLRKLTILLPARFNDIILILSQLVALEELSLASPLEDNPSAPSGRPFQVPQLSTLSFGGAENAFILNHIDLPSLTTLRLSQFDEHDVAFFICPCIVRSSANITSLSVAPTTYDAFGAFLMATELNSLKNLTVTLFAMTRDEERRCAVALSLPLCFPNLESLTLLVTNNADIPMFPHFDQESTPRPTSIRPFLDGVAMRVSNAISNDVHMKLARFAVDFSSPFGITTEDMHNLVYLQQSMSITVSMPNGRPLAVRKLWECGISARS
ncbi:F-box domain-containing protein [Mycena indigotica]|uniref:F-box domain-containing protein n=1 Tax=Mycena indigotica TaxID=2126181 RepID=A0A8H6SMV2_9AGAR|nr:F-box domain-containing protein [Mycena indigotica]KAF7302301.1 F-box domain-containing protein [Mycena indigotica]